MHRPELSHRMSGLTLLEVLVALAILAIALAAAIKVTSQAIKQTAYLQERTIATFAGMYIMNEYRAGLRSSATGEANGATTCLGQPFVWRARVTPSRQPRIQTILLQVGYAAENDNTLQQPLANLTGFLDAPAK